MSVFWKNWFIGQKSLRNREKYNTLLQICKTCPNSTNQKIVDDFDSEDSDSTPLLENSITMDHCHESGAQPHRPQVSVITVVEFYACSGKIQKIFPRKGIHWTTIESFQTEYLMCKVLSQGASELQ